jgi:hypothetical protein
MLIDAAPKKESRDFYKILKISRSASEQEIKKAFKRLSVQLHPDKVRDSFRFQEIFRCLPCRILAMRKGSYSTKKCQQVPFCNLFQFVCLSFSLRGAV